MIQLEANADTVKSLLTTAKEIVLSQTSNPSKREAIIKEVHELANISEAEQLHTSTIVKTVTEGKMHLPMSKLAYKLFMNFLRQNDLILILAMLNRWFVFDIDKEERGRDDETRPVVEMNASAAPLQQGHVELELLKGSDTLKFRELELKQQIETLQGEDEEGMSKAQKNEHTSKIESLQAKLVKTANQGIKSTIPLPPSRKDKMK